MPFELQIDKDPIHFVQQIIDGQIEIASAIQEVFSFQLRHNTFYRHFSEALFPELSGYRQSSSLRFPIDQIPLIPIRAFKELDIVLDEAYMAKLGLNPFEGLKFKSSGTSSMTQSTHYVPVSDLYSRSVKSGFALAYPKRSSSMESGILLPVLSYLPGYRDNPFSSLITMMEMLETQSTDLDSKSNSHSRSQILSDPKAFIHTLRELREPVILFGAAFGLLDVIEYNQGSHPLKLPTGSILIETGGMKTHRREIQKSELRKLLSDGFGLAVEQIHSEYGMCEMLSQSYSKGDDWFTPSPWLLFQIRHPDNPLEALSPGQRGKLGYIDLCNVFSCPFVLTDDEAELNDYGQIRLYGRWPGEEARGCNFLIDRD